jgi:hypothetical protein
MELAESAECSDIVAEVITYIDSLRSYKAVLLVLLYMLLLPLMLLWR